jgi:hypothetical protein
MSQYARPSVDNLINNLPVVLKSSRQFLAWNEVDGKKAPLKQDGTSWGNYRDPSSWRTFDDVIDLLDRGKAFGIGLALPSQKQADILADFNLITGLVASDGDAKRSPSTTPYQVPTHISDYIRSAQSYSEFSPSLKGLRALVFGTLPTEKQNITKSFDDGTELSLYRGGWVTLSGLIYEDSSPTIEHRQEIIDQIFAELCPEFIPCTPAAKESSAGVTPVREAENFILDWSRTASESHIRQFLQGWNRTPKQLQDMTETWELKRGWNHGNTPDNSMYTKRIVEEALWLRPFFHWSLQYVVDIVITFCKRNQLDWSFGRAKKQIFDWQQRILATARRPELYLPASLVSAVVFDTTKPTPPLTCIGSQITSEDQRGADSALTLSKVNRLASATKPKSRDTFADTLKPADKPKVSPGFRHKSLARDAVVQALERYSGWVKLKSIARETGKTDGSVKKQLQRLRAAGFVDSDGRGRYRKHNERKLRKLSHAVQNQSLFAEESIRSAGCSPAHWVSRIKTIELQPWFEIERAKIQRSRNYS